MSPRLSIVIPVYDGRPFLRAAVTSVLAEAMPDLEVIVVDDGSTDGSAETIADLPVTILRRENGGTAAAENTGLAAARGEIVTFLEADDLLVPGGLRVRLDWLERHPEAEAVGGLPMVFLDDVPSSAAPRLPPGIPERLTLDFYRSGAFFPVVTWLYMFRRRLLDRVGPLDPTYRRSSDCDFLFRVLEHTDIPLLRELVVRRRIHAGNHSLRQSAREGIRLCPEGVAEAIAINARYGIVHAEYVPWEIGYLDDA